MSPDDCADRLEEAVADFDDHAVSLKFGCMHCEYRNLVVLASPIAVAEVLDSLEGLALEVFGPDALLAAHDQVATHRSRLADLT